MHIFTIIWHESWILNANPKKSKKKWIKINYVYTFIRLLSLSANLIFNLNLFYQRKNFFFGFKHFLYVPNKRFKYRYTFLYLNVWIMKNYTHWKFLCILYLLKGLKIDEIFISIEEKAKEKRNILIFWGNSFLFSPKSIWI